jgi:hypothetical protein
MAHDIFLFTNNAASTLANSIASGDTVLSVVSGDGAKFPAPGVDEVAALTIVDTVLGLLEIVYITARSGDTMTIVRGREGTAPAPFGAGIVVSHRVTAATLLQFQTLAIPPSGGSVLREPSAGDSQQIETGAVDDVALTLKGAVGQTADLQQWLSSADAVLASLSDSGALVLADAMQALRLKSTQAGTENVPSIRVGGDLHGFRLSSGKLMAVVDNTDAGRFEIELVDLGNLDDLSLITKRVADLLYFPLVQGFLSLDQDDPYLDLRDTAGAAFPGFNRVRFYNGQETFSIGIHSDAEAPLGAFVVVPYDVNGATDHQFLIANVLAAHIAAVGTAVPNATTIITREKGDNRFTPIAHASDTGNPHSVIAGQVAYTGALGSDVQEALDTIEAQPEGGVISVYGRSGIISALVADYQAFYVRLTGSTMTGALLLPAGGSGAAAIRVDEAETLVAPKAPSADPTFTGTINGDIMILANGLTVKGELRIEQAVTLRTAALTSSANIALGMAGASKKTLTLDHDGEITVTGEIADQTVELWITQGTTGGTATWVGVDKWIGGVAPVLSVNTGDIDIIALVSASDGTTVIGQHMGTAA